MNRFANGDPVILLTPSSLVGVRGLVQAASSFSNYYLVGIPDGRQLYVNEVDMSPVIIETSCRTCRRKNDIGVAVCWCCGNRP